MQIIWAQQPIPNDCGDSLFLAGPTPRSQTVPSWRPEALDILQDLKFSGTVFVPEAADGDWKKSYISQVEWEDKGLITASCIVFWVPRNLETMPGFTTNVEWGEWHKSGKVVLGAPFGAPKMKYLRYKADKFKVPVADTLKKTLSNALALI